MSVQNIEYWFHTPHSDHLLALLARRLGVCEKSVRRLDAKGELAAVRIGRSVRWKKQDVEDFINSRRQSA